MTVTGRTLAAGQAGAQRVFQWLSAARSRVSSVGHGLRRVMLSVATVVLTLLAAILALPYVAIWFFAVPPGQ